MEYQNEYLNELFENLDSPVAILELWDFAQEELTKDPKNPELRWIVAFSEIFKWERSSDASSVKTYYQLLDAKNALITLKFLEICDFIELIPAYYKGINKSDDLDLMQEIDTWIEENDVVIDGTILQIILAKKDWFYSVM